MKVKIILALSLVFSIGSLLADIHCGEVVACTAQAEAARENVPFYLRWALPTAKQVRESFGANCQMTPAAIAAAIEYQKQQEAQAKNEHEKRAHAMVREKLESQL